MHSRLPKVGTAVGLVAGLVASSLAMAPLVKAAEEETAGNNLAVPVIWSEEDRPLELRGDPELPRVDGPTAACDSGSETPTEMAALQQEDLNSWQAETKFENGNLVDELDWGDNLGKDWNVGSKVRVETALYKDVTDAPMDGYVMCYVSGEKQDEMWGATLTSGNGPETTEPAMEATAEKGPKDPSKGKPTDPGVGDGTDTETGDGTDTETGDGTDTETGDSTDTNAENGEGQTLTAVSMNEAMIYTAGARLTIQRIAAGADPTWDATQHRWVGTGVADPEFSRAIYQSGEGGPGNFGSEVNVSGKLIYGFQWDTAGLYNGEYRITFSLDGPSDLFPSGSGTSLESATIRESVDPAPEETPTSFVMAHGSGDHMGGGGMGGGTGGGMGGGEGDANIPVMVQESNLSFVDVALSGGLDAPVVPEPEPTNPPAPPTGDGGGSAPSGGTGGAAGDGAATGSGAPGPGQPEAVVPVEIASPIMAQQRIQQRARIKAPKSSKQRVQTRLILTEEPIFTDQGVTIRWRVTKRLQDNCTIRNRSGEVSVKFTKRGRCTVVAWAPSPNPLVYAPFNEKRIYKVRNTL